MGINTNSPWCEVAEGAANSYKVTNAMPWGNWVITNALAYYQQFLMAMNVITASLQVS